MENKVLVMTAVEAEKEAVLRGLRNDRRFDVVIAGVGPIAAAVNTMAALASSRYDLVVSAGIGGGFAGKAPVGSVVIASEVIVADLGSQTPGGFIGMDELGFGTTRLQVESNISLKLVEAIRTAGLQVYYGPILTLSTTTGTAATASELSERVQDAGAEAMEGYGVAAAAYRHSLPFVEIRTISNVIGPRDRASWRIGEALAALEQTSIFLPEVTV
ncbi:futalosine hydrolase [Cohnella sp.]|uniref:futalosine hydrolase n=1 Tax=Cohnella sp. TaxID=1883426 RepID=UPI0035633A4B